MSSKTRKEKVLELLEDHEWHDGHEFLGPDVGGTDGLRRLRELRSEGWEIEKRLKPDRPQGSRVYQYRLSLADKDEWFFHCLCKWNERENNARLIKENENCPALPHAALVRY